MRIGIDVTCWNNHRGYGRYARSLLCTLLALDQENTYVGFADDATIAQATFPPGLHMVRVPQSEPPAQAAAAHGRRKLSDIWRMTRAVQRAGVGLMFFPTSYSYFPVLGRTRCVVVVHDAIAERWPQLIFPTRAGRLAWTIKSRMACWQADRVVTVSHAAARAIRQHLHVPARRLRVVYEAADSVFQVHNTEADREQRRQVLARYGIPQDTPLVLYVGGFSPHKCVDTLVSAFAQLHRPTLPAQTAGEEIPTERPPVHLALVGETSREVFYSCLAALREQVRREHLDPHVTFTGYVPDADLVHLYQAASCLVLPSRDEGFGLPVVEAMACGTPVVASRAGSLPELVGDAGLLVAPERVDDLACALSRLVSQPALRATLRERGLQRAAQLSWEQAADDLVAVFRELAPASRRLERQLHRRGAQHA